MLDVRLYPRIIIFISIDMLSNSCLFILILLFINVLPLLLPISNQSVVWFHVRLLLDSCKGVKQLVPFLSKGCWELS